MMTIGVLRYHLRHHIHHHLEAPNLAALLRAAKASGKYCFRLAVPDEWSLRWPALQLIEPWLNLPGALDGVLVRMYLPVRGFSSAFFRCATAARVRHKAASRQGRPAVANDGLAG
jgi:hypothetical protein